MEQADAIDQKEDALYGSDKTGDEIPEEIRDQDKRIEKLKELKKQLEESGKEKINKTDPDAVFMKTGNGITTFTKSNSFITKTGIATSGKAIYSKRKHTVESPFGHIKSIMGFTSFILRGIDKVKSEFKLVSTAHNLRKIWLYLRANQQNLAGMCPAVGC